MFRNVFASLTAVILAASVATAGDVKSSLQPGDKLPGPFAPLNINGPTPDEKVCLVCRNGNNPVVMIFARTADEQTAKLIKAVDAVTQKNTDCKMGSFVVFCSDEEKLEGKLKEMAKAADLKKTVLSIDTPTGPTKYKVSQDADITVVLYNEREVKANHTFKKGELKDANIEAIVKDVSKITPSK